MLARTCDGFDERGLEFGQFPLPARRQPQHRVPLLGLVGSRFDVELRPAGMSQSLSLRSLSALLVPLILLLVLSMLLRTLSSLLAVQYRANVLSDAPSQESAQESVWCVNNTGKGAQASSATS